MNRMKSETNGVAIEKKRSPFSSSLRAKLSEELMDFVTAFHRGPVDVFYASIRASKWQEVSDYDGSVRLLMEVIPANMKVAQAMSDDHLDKTPFEINGEV